MIFATARDGLRTLLSRRTVGWIVEGMNAGDIRIDGNPVPSRVVESPAR